MKQYYTSTFVLLLLFLISSHVMAQGWKSDKFSVGVSYGGSQILDTANIRIGKSASALGHFQADARYHFSSLLGVSGHYAYTQFSENDGVSPFVHHRLALEGIMSLGRAFTYKTSFNYYSPFDVFLHVGAGLTVWSHNTDRDRILTVLGGLSPQYKIRKWLSVKADASYLMNVKQHVDFTGVKVADFNKKRHLLNYSVGLQFHIGANRPIPIRY